MSEPTACPNCATPLQGRYCHACGQKRIEPEEQRFGWFLRQLLESLTMVDERFLGSLGRLLFRPGSLDRDWLEGRRKRNLAPLSLFLIANVVYFFYPPLSDLNLSLAEQLAQPHGALAQQLVSARLEARGIEFEDYALQYQAEATNLAKVLVILHAPLFALALLALHWRRGRYFVDHLAVSLHFWAFLLFVVMVVPWLLWLLVTATGLGSKALLQLTLAGIVLAYAWRQIQVAYAQPGWLALAKLPLLLAGLVAAHLVYRAVQFFAAFALS
ncbi:DUF3667 domain-containing protein [Thioalkalivibrio sp. XN279]|uniref:DUF3667 domain-containing protein n=1 Tax=Thioalkalivibrio sp. XN279 TaxID=2714953 RepID=UPI00140B8759|nr:DUF3667 domain-containing protein [Thioalkalivibrio sp. XN279]NHA15590.1 DUF3667 domain-containing protein [Thioalkalivibrio sp. XN279]